MKISLMRKIDFFIGGGLCLVLDLMERLKRILPQKKTMPETRSVLVTKYLGMGSILLATPALQALKEAYPSCRIVLLTFEENGIFARKLLLFDSVITIRSTSLLNLVMDSFTALIDIRRQRFDYLLDLEFFARYSTIISYLSAATCRVGYYMPQIWRGDLLHIPVHFNPYRHVSEIFAAQVEAIDVTVTNYTVTPLAVAETAVMQVKNILAAEEIDCSYPLVLININASDLSLERRLPRENFIKIIDALAINDNCRMLLVGSVAEKSYVATLWDSLADVSRRKTVNLAGKTDLEQFIALLARCTILITNDSGPLHMAASLGKRTLSFFGPETPDLYGPLGSGHTIFYAGIYCSPCLNVFNAKKSMCNGNNRCMQAIDTDRIISEALSILANQSQS